MRECRLAAAAAFEPEIILDLSSNNGVIDWKKVSEHRDEGGKRVTHVILRCSMGKAGRDTRFLEYLSGARSVGIICGVYHFFRPDSTGIDQAKHFLSVIAGISGLFCKAVDVESPSDGTSIPKDAYAQELADFVSHVFIEQDSTFPEIYTSQGEWNKLVGTAHDALFAQCLLWVANYTGAAAPALPRCWKTWIRWQYTSSGKISGITGRVDLNRDKPIALQNFWIASPVKLPYRISQEYGENYEYYMKCCKLPGHEGIDFAKPKGEPVLASQSGVVKLIAADNGSHPYGNQVRLEHKAIDGNFETVYAHLDAFAEGIEVGDSVIIGDLIGYVGTTGNSTGYHVHLTVKKNGVIVNPELYLR